MQYFIDLLYEINISHLQTSLIIIKSCLLIVICGRTEIESEWVFKKQKHVQMWYILSEPAGMSIIINSSPAPKFKFCSVFSAKNPTVNDASGVTMLSEKLQPRQGWFLVCRQNNNSALHVSFPSVIPDNV